MKTRVCPECGATFESSARIQLCCSDECKRRRKLRQIKASYDRNYAKVKERRRKARLARKAHNARKSAALARDLKMLGETWEATAPVTLDHLMHAKTKPANTSEVRWRMELRRRAMQKRFGGHVMDCVPHPDILQ